MATHSSLLAWRIPPTEEPGGLQSHGVAESDTTEQLSTAHQYRKSQNWMASPPSLRRGFFFKIFINSLLINFIFNCAGSSLLDMGFLQLLSVGATLCCSVWALGLQASVAEACSLSSCGIQAQLPLGMWNLPRAEVKPASLSLAGGFLTTGPPVKSEEVIF